MPLLKMDFFLSYAFVFGYLLTLLASVSTLTYLTWCLPLLTLSFLFDKFVPLIPFLPFLPSSAHAFEASQPPRFPESQIIPDPLLVHWTLTSLPPPLSLSTPSCPQPQPLLHSNSLPPPPCHRHDRTGPPGRRLWIAIYCRL